MADIELVIKIPEEVYKEICDKNYYSLKGKEALRIGVINGTVLPKGHGRLIDADALESDCGGEWNGLYITEDKYKQSTIDNAPTIIEADKVQREE